ncbi:MAG TPA: FG-GAP-like repeat-containing protein, partial [Planctomycetaceae bacterium]|nr:FG-GAP-like repeat-containing protein [Planctomycetaceae bacterium]
LHVGLLEEAEENYRYVIQQKPDHVSAHSRLAFLLAATGQRWEALPHYFSLVSYGDWSVDELAILADLERPLEVEEYLARCQQYAPDDLLVNLGLAINAVLVKNVDVAKQQLRDVVTRDPQRLSAQALLGELMLLEDDATFSAWLSQLPKLADQHPEIWLVRGLRYRQKNMPEAAVRCFWEALRLEPNHRRANYQLGQTLISLDQPAGKAFIQRADLLFELTGMLDRVLKSRGRDQEAIRRVTTLLRQTGRHWEAWAWAISARPKFSTESWPESVVADLEPTLTPQTPRTLAWAELTRTHDYSRFELPQLIADQNKNSRPTSPNTDEIKIRFEDESENLGIDFVYFNGDEDLAKPGARMFEQTGGGVAVIDYDRDNWPDLVFAQGSLWPEGSRSPQADPEFTNHLYRNRSGIRFQQVTQLAGLDDLGFGQGIAVGDFDNDGFPDVYAANIGRNSLYRNNGDGTFENVSLKAGLHEEQWTASCLIADLNSDGFPDLFDVNYLEGENVFTLRCQGLACSPSVFSGAQNRFLISRGDGTFESIADATPKEDSKSLGIVALSLDQPGRLSLFISNDQVPNYLLMSRPRTDWPYVQFENESLTRGVAYNEHGLAMAGMGIAIGDVNGNGRYDFFVTNF